MTTNPRGPREHGAVRYRLLRQCEYVNMAGERCPVIKAMTSNGRWCSTRHSIYAKRVAKRLERMRKEGR